MEESNKTQTIQENFGIPVDFEYLRFQSKYSFTKIVKTQARKFALNDLVEKMETHSKMEN